VGIGLAGLLILIQLVPYGRDHNNPPVTSAARWTDAASEQLATEACYDCHSNLTEWRWYSKIARAPAAKKPSSDGGGSSVAPAKTTVRPPPPQQPVPVPGGTGDGGEGEGDDD
jgi:hypothetical protein